jgi:hypothetical protein
MPIMIHQAIISKTNQDMTWNKTGSASNVAYVKSSALIFLLIRIV